MTVDAALPISDSEAPAEPQEIIKMALEKTIAAGPLYFCHGGEHTLTLNAQQHSAWINQGVCLKEPPGKTLPLSASPAIGAFQTFADTGATWTITCPTKNAAAPAEAFQLWGQTEYTSPAYKIDVSLGHHRLDFVEASGNEQFQVIEYGEETTLKAREISYYTKAAMQFPVKWTLPGKELGPASPDDQGWVTLDRFEATNQGIHPVTVEVPSLYYESGYFRKEIPVHALTKTPWGNDAKLQLNKEPVIDLITRGVVCTRGKPYSLTLSNENLLLQGSTLTLSSDDDPKALGLTFDPDLDIPRIIDGAEMSWSFSSTASTAKSGLFTLRIACSKLKKDWEIAGRLISEKLADEVKKIEVDGKPVSNTGAIFFPEDTAPLTLTFEPSMRGLSVWLDEVGSSDFELTFDPPLKQPITVPEDLVLSWDVTSGINSGFFSLQVVCPDVATKLDIPCRLVANYLADDIEKIEVSGPDVDPYPINLAGMGVLLRKGQNNLNFTITISFKPESTLLGLKYKLTWLEGDLGVPPNQTIPSLDIEKIIENDKITIGWKSFKTTKDGNFTLELICEGRSLIIPGVVVNERSLNAIARIHFNDKDYPANTTEDNLRYPRDGVRRRVKVFLNSSPLAELIILGFIKPGIFLTQGGVDQKTSIDPTSGSTLEVDVANREFHFDMWGNPFNFGGNYTINITFPHKINVASLYCYITSPDPR